MIPLRDNIRARRVPVVNYTLIALTSLAFFVQLQQETTGVSMIESFGMIPQRVLDPEDSVVLHGVELAPSAVWPWLTLLTCVFLHGGWLHFLGNMWFLHIFGDNVEDRLGRVGYAAFYLTAGIAASAAHLASAPASPQTGLGTTATREPPSGSEKGAMSSSC